MNLAAPSGAPSNRRPHQLGRVHGAAPDGTPLSATVEWLVDSGADVAVVQDRVGARFATRPTGATASPTTGGRGILMVSGLDVEVQVETSGGFSSPLAARGAVGVKSSNAGSNLIGVEQLDAVGATLIWSSTARQGTLVEDRLVDPSGRREWWADPWVMKDADLLLDRVRRTRRGSGTTTGGPEAVLDEVWARYEHEVEQLLSGVVGYREARAVMTAGIDSWNSHLAPVRALDRARRRAHAEELGAVTCRLLGRCASIEDPEIRFEIERGLRRLADNVSRHSP